MTLLFVSFIAGMLTVLAPCILPLLPVIIGSSVGARSKTTPLVVISSLALSILLFTYLLKASTALIAVPTHVWGYISGGILLFFGLILLFPTLWERLPIISQISVEANAVVGTGYQKKSIWGDILVGAALGPVFSSCSPTYFVILATVLPANFLLGTVYLLAYIAGLVLVLGLIAILGQRLTSKLQIAADSRGWFKRVIGALFIIIGIFIMNGTDKKIESWVLERGYISGIIEIEQQLLKTIQTFPTAQSVVDPQTTTIASVPSITVPSALARTFLNTDFSQADPRLEAAVSGGPGKDGIPAIDTPSFIPLKEFDRPNSVQAIVMVGQSETRVYPYNILTWHEIVNDTIDDIPIAITFCPLCGSAIVFNRTLPDGTVSTFGVSGSLLESNMIMYDRVTENLWQQSTGRTLAGSWYPAELKRESFQLLTLGDIRATYPDALILSEATGYGRDYAHNPYAGYDTDDRFIFEPSTLDHTFDPKTIMVVFEAHEETFVAPWLTLRQAGSVEITSKSTTYILTVTDTGELTIKDNTGAHYPFYFEMWFSASVQHQGNLVVINP